MLSPGRGCLLALEGIDGCGKTKQAELLAASLDAVLTREPGATELGLALRHLLLDTDAPPLGLRTEALLMAADRAQHIDAVIEPALAAGRTVVTDRFSASTLAYQGYGRGLDIDDLAQMVMFATAGQRADLSILVDVPLEVAACPTGRPCPRSPRAIGPGLSPKGAGRVFGLGPG